MTAALAYAYSRFSTSKQAEGDSARRQTEAAQHWATSAAMELDSDHVLQ